MLVRAALQGLPKDFIGENGEDFMLDCFSDTAFAYGLTQVMLNGKRRDPKHYDGGASLLHMGLTIFGARDLECFFTEATAVIPQDPGAIYVGNLCAVEHQVVHGRAKAFSLFGESTPNGVHITVMFRCDVFRHNQARNRASRPAPADMYEIVNAVVARHLATATLVLPDFAACAHEVVGVKRSLDCSEAGSPSKRKALPEQKT